MVLPDSLVKVGGVTEAYFEWIRSLSHIRFGRMQDPHDELRGSRMVSLLEELEENASIHMSEQVKKGFAQAPDEIDLIRSGLDDTVRLTFQGIREVLDEHNPPAPNSYRTAAIVVALRKTARSYLDVGGY